MIDTRTAPHAALLLRMALGIVFLAHAGLKIVVFAAAGTAQIFDSLDLPPALAYVTIACELVGAVALILGAWPRLAAFAAIPILLGAIASARSAVRFFFANPKGGWEYPAFWIVGFVALAAAGDGDFALLPTPVPGARSA